MTTARRIRAERTHGMTIIYTVMVSILILIVVQFVLLMVALEDFLSEGSTAIVGAAIGSGLCFLATCWLIRYVLRQRMSG